MALQGAPDLVWAVDPELTALRQLPGMCTLLQFLRRKEWATQH